MPQTYIETIQSVMRAQVNGQFVDTTVVAQQIAFRHPEIRAAKIRARVTEEAIRRGALVERDKDTRRHPLPQLDGDAFRYGAIAAALGDHSDDAFCSMAKVLQFRQGQMLFRWTESESSFVVVTAGLVKVVLLLPDGRQQIVALLSATESFWVRGSASEGLYIEAVSEGEICLLSGQQFIDELVRHPVARQALLMRSLDDLDHARSHLLVLGRMTALEKVATFLLELWSKSDRLTISSKQRDSNLPTLALGMLREDMADYLGMTLETVSRCLTKLKRQGVIRLIDARTVEICDPDSLELIGHRV